MTSMNVSYRGAVVTVQSEADVWALYLRWLADRRAA